MSLQPRPIDPIPDMTVRVAKAAFPKGNPYLILRDPEISGPAVCGYEQGQLSGS